ncbi:MAG: helix-turn-helix domain-containing protein [candidate division Zixibacteria bacterium]|nr:helix-turn-helix domain-containing protein [candidate division Zixibacteria bacterium]
MSGSDRRLLTAKELSEELSVKISTIYSWTHMGFIPTVKLGRLIRFRRSSIQVWLEKKEEPGRKQRKVVIDFGDGSL